MHVYGDNRHHSNAWNAVDVLVDGLLQHGDVIDVAKGGLIIDFRRAGHRAQFVKYGRIFRFSNSQEASATAVQVLLHRLPDGAWIWYPGTTVDMGDYHNEHLVCVQVPLYGTIPELVPRDQVRPPPADGEWEKFRVLEKDFVVRLGKLPDACGADGSQLAGEIFQRDLALWFDVWCISLSQCKRTLQYLQRQDASPVKSRRLAEIYASAQEKATRAIPTRTAPPMLHQGPTSTSNGDGMPLQPVLLLEVFRALDSIQRYRCRRVCPLWNTLLSTDGHFADVRVSGHKAAEYGAVSHYSYAYTYWLVAGAIKCLRSTTRMVVLSQLHSGNLRQHIHMTGLLQCLVSSGRLRALVFHDCTFYMGAGITFPRFIWQTAELIAGCSPLADSVILKKGRLSDGGLHATVALHSFSGQSPQETERQLWDLFENGLVLCKPLNRAALAERIRARMAQHASEDGNESEEFLMETLCYYQTSDPRLPTDYPHHMCGMSNQSGLDVSKLTTLTALVLNEWIGSDYPNRPP